MTLPTKNKFRYFNITLLLFDILMVYLVYVREPPRAEPPPSSPAPVSLPEVLGENVAESPPSTPSASPLTSSPAPSTAVPVPALTAVTASVNESPAEVEESPPAADSPNDSETSDQTPSSNQSAVSPPPTPPPEPPSATATAKQVVQNLSHAEKTLELYELFSREVRSVFDFASWEKAVAEASLEVDAYQLVGETVVNGDWAEQEVELTTADGETQHYLLVLVREDSGWRLWGTIAKD